MAVLSDPILSAFICGSYLSASWLLLPAPSVLPLVLSLCQVGDGINRQTVSVVVAG